MSYKDIFLDEWQAKVESRLKWLEDKVKEFYKKLEELKKKK